MVGSLLSGLLVLADENTKSFSAVAAKRRPRVKCAAYRGERGATFIDGIDG